MNAIALVEAQWTRVNSALHSLAPDLTPEQWTFRISPGQNLLGFTLWHIPACQDWTVQTWVRNIPEVREREPWTQTIGLDRLGLAFGISLEAADAIARGVTAGDMLAYADAVLAENRSWLYTLRDADLDRVPDNRAHLTRHPAYQTGHILRRGRGNVEGHPRGRHLHGHRARARPPRRSPARGRTGASDSRPLTTAGPPGSPRYAAAPGVDLARVFTLVATWRSKNASSIWSSRPASAMAALWKPGDPAGRTRQVARQQEGALTGGTAHTTMGADQGGSARRLGSTRKT